MSDQTPDTTTPPPAPEANLTSAGPIVARFGRYYRNTRYLMFVMFMGFGIWCFYDGYFKWPKENEAAIKKGQNPPHKDYDVQLQRALAIILPPLAVVVLV